MESAWSSPLVPGRLGKEWGSTDTMGPPALNLLSVPGGIVLTHTFELKTLLASLRSLMRAMVLELRTPNMAGVLFCASSSLLNAATSGRLARRSLYSDCCHRRREEEVLRVGIAPVTLDASSTIGPNIGT